MIMPTTSAAPCWRDHCRICLSLCNLAGLFSLLSSLLDDQLGLLCLLLGNLFLLDSRGIFITKVNVTQEEIDQYKIIL
jgi:hypothetical protein